MLDVSFHDKSLGINSPKGLFCTCSGARYFKKHEKHRLQKSNVHNESPSCPSFGDTSPRGPCGRKQADAGEKNRKRCRLSVDVDPDGKHAWQTLSQLCLLSATWVLGEHFG